MAAPCACHHRRCNLRRLNLACAGLHNLCARTVLPMSIEDQSGASVVATPVSVQIRRARGCKSSPRRPLAASGPVWSEVLVPPGSGGVCSGALFVAVSNVVTVDDSSDAAVGMRTGAHEAQEEAKLCAGLSLVVCHLL